MIDETEKCHFRAHCGKSAHSITSSHVGKCCALVVSTTLELVRPRHALRCYLRIFQLFPVAHSVYVPTMLRAENPPRGREHLEFEC
jgi:hypothetical protein